MERLKSTLLERRLEVVRKRKESLTREEARLIRLVHQKKATAAQLAKVKKEKFAAMIEEAKLLRVLKQGNPTL